MSVQLTLTPTLDERASQTSYSALVKHRECPQAWLYRYGYRLEEDRTGTSPYAILGSWWSVLRAAEAIQRANRRWGGMPFLPEALEVDRGGEWTFDPLTITTKVVLQASVHAWKALSDDDKDEFATALGDSLPARLVAMFKTWRRENHHREENERPLGVEVYVERELPGTEAEGQPAVKLIGYVDEIFLDMRRNMVVIRDNKTMKSLSNATTSLDDLMDSQLQLYTWIAAPALKDAGLPAPRAVSYDRIRSTAPKEPQLTLAGGLSKAVTDYDLSTYYAWADTDTVTPAVAEYVKTDAFKNLPPDARLAIEELPAGRLFGKLGEFMKTGPRAGQPKFGVYEVDAKVIEALDSPSELAKWIGRTLKPVQQNVVTAHLQAAIDSALDIRRTVERGKATGAAPRNLTRRGCQWCPFADLCRSQMIGGNSGEYDLEALGLRIREEKSS